MSRVLSLLLIGILLVPLRVSAQPAAKGKIISIFRQGNTTKLVIETKEALVAGRNVFVGDRQVPVTVDDKLSQSGELLYYGASTPGKTDLKEGDKVFTEARGPSKIPRLINVKLEGAYNYEEKRKAEVTAVQAGRAMFDRGTLHQVRELDLYRVYGPEGKYKGLLEVQGIGDLQSNGKLYNAFEEFGKDAETTTRPGDRLAWVGQRKKLGLGLIGGIMLPNQKVLDTTELTFGTGLLWNIMFRDGWGIEVLFGLYSRTGTGGHNFFYDDGCGSANCARIAILNQRVAQFIAPVWVKKNFFFPHMISPFLGAGIALFDGKHVYETISSGTSFTKLREVRKVTTLVPVLGGGVELFPARFIRPRFEVRYFKGPKLRAAGDTFNSESVFYSAGLFSAW